MFSDLNVWEEVLARQHALRREVARERLAAIVRKPRQRAYRAAVARGLRELANRLDGQARPDQRSPGTREALGPSGRAWGVLH
jgi:hypothetical protein